MENKYLDKNKKPHAIFIPYPLQGHFNPSVNLAVNLASQGFTVTFISTHAVHHHQTASAATENHDLFANVRDSGLDIRYSTISDGLPVGFDRSLNHDQFMAALLHVFSAHVEEAVADVIASGEDVHCLVADTFFVWPSKIAKKFGLLYVSFWTEPALVFTLYYHLDLLRKNRHFDSQERRNDPIDYIPGVRAMEVKDTPSYLQESDTTTVCHQIIFNCFNEAKKADFVLCNTVQELENDTVSALQAEIPFYPIGPIFSNDFANGNVATSLWPESDCTHWLDNKARGSVLYVSFGSYAHLSKNDLTEIAYGLSLSKVSFIWVLRPDIVSSDDKDPLPVGYKEEISDRAMIVPWCCQKKILTHPSIGGFLSHCGWNSTLESLWCEVPLLCFPLYTDQFTNRKLVVDDWKIGISLSANKIVTKEEVSNNVNRLMCGESKDEFRKRIMEAKKIMETALSPTGSSHRNMSRFIQDVKRKIEKLVQSKKS